MEDRSRFTGYPRQALLIAGMVLLSFAALAGGYVIRLATSGSAASTGVTIQHDHAQASESTAAPVGDRWWQDAATAAPAGAIPEQSSPAAPPADFGCEWLEGHRAC